MTPGLSAVVVAAGESRRMGTDKLWIDFFGRPAWRWSVDLLLGIPGLTRLALVVPEADAGRFASALPAALDRCLLVAGGASRAASVRNGLGALAADGLADDAVILVHDAARPALTTELVGRLLAASEDAAAVVPVVGVHDTLLRDGAVVDRARLVAVQTPQLGRLGDLRKALVGRDEFSDEGTALAAAGYEVTHVVGEVANRKLTEPGDAVLMRALLRDRAIGTLSVGERPGTGIGFDAHRLEAGRPLRLGGLDWPDQRRGLAGHSDGDVALHAVIDALLGAARLGDIGAHFPSDERWEGADSGELLRGVVDELAGAGLRPAGIDVAIVAAQPAIAPRRAEMVSAIARLVGIAESAVGVKGTTSDGLGLPAGEGIAAYAVATVEPA